MKKRPLITVLIVFLFLLHGCGSERAAPPVGAEPTLAALLGAAKEPGFREALQPREWQFPADHGPHEGFRNEWWYFTGNLEDRIGRRFGYELTMFRFLLSPEQRDEVSSRWAASRVFVAHLAVTDVVNDDFQVAERWARGAVGLAGATADPVHVWLYDWSLRYRPAPADGAWQLNAADAAFGISLTLQPDTDPVLHGDRGRSQKSSQPGNASYYYSVPRLATSGVLRIGDEQYEVTGSSWLDREWSSSALDEGQSGWDWFSLQLADGSNLMFYQLRRNDGTIDSHSAGTWMPAAEASRHLAHDAVEIEVLDAWDSPAGTRYPIEWRVIVPSAELDLRIRPVIRNQELDTRVRYWEGAVDMSGMRGNEPVTGRGYVEMTGYAHGKAAAEDVADDTFHEPERSQPKQ